MDGWIFGGLVVMMIRDLDPSSGLGVLLGSGL